MLNIIAERPLANSEAVSAKGVASNPFFMQPALFMSRTCWIDWRQPAATIERRLRAFDPFPGAKAVLGGETIACWRGALRPLATGAAAPGEVLAAGDELTVACGEGALALLELQRPGGRRMTAAEFLRGWKPAPGARIELPAIPPGPSGAV